MQEWWFKVVNDAVHGKASCTSRGIPTSGQESLAASTQHELQHLPHKEGAGDEATRWV